MPSLLDRFARKLLGGLFSHSDFAFLDPGPLVDGELELIAPNEADLDDLLVAANHPQTLASDESGLTREQALDFLRHAPGGREPRNRSRNLAPTYHFWMKTRATADYTPPLKIAGAITLRVSNTPDLAMYLGHIGYHVHAPCRGRHFAARAVRLLLPLAKRHGMSTLWITCNPDNYASMKSIQRAGGIYVETVQVPTDHTLAQLGEFEKCRYRFDL